MAKKTKSRTTRSGKIIEVTRSKQKGSNNYGNERSKTRSRTVTQADGSFVTKTKRKSSGPYAWDAKSRIVERSRTESMPQPNTVRSTSTKRTRTQTSSGVTRRKAVNGFVVSSKTRKKK